jgi:hypothetical protein
MAGEGAWLGGGGGVGAGIHSAPVHQKRLSSLNCGGAVGGC